MAQKKVSPLLDYVPELENCRHCGRPNTSRFTVTSWISAGGPSPKPEEIHNGYVFDSAYCVECDREVEDKLTTEVALDDLQEQRKHFRDGKGRGFRRDH